VLVAAGFLLPTVLVALARTGFYGDDGATLYRYLIICLVPVTVGLACVLVPRAGSPTPRSALVVVPLAFVVLASLVTWRQTVQRNESSIAADFRDRVERGLGQLRAAGRHPSLLDEPVPYPVSPPAGTPAELMSRTLGLGGRLGTVGDATADPLVTPDGWGRLHEVTLVPLTGRLVPRTPCQVVAAHRGGSWTTPLPKAVSGVTTQVEVDVSTDVRVALGLAVRTPDGRLQAAGKVPQYVSLAPGEHRRLLRVSRLEWDAVRVVVRNAQSSPAHVCVRTIQVTAPLSVSSPA
jgi:hypothetical protein